MRVALIASFESGATSYAVMAVFVFPPRLGFAVGGKYARSIAPTPSATMSASGTDFPLDGGGRTLVGPGRNETSPVLIGQRTAPVVERCLRWACP